MENILKYKKIIISSLLTVFIGFLVFLIYYNLLLFRVASISPSNGKVNIGQSAIIFNFTKDIEPVNINQVIGSKDVVIGTEVDGKKLIVFVNNIEKNNKYSLEIKNIKSKNGESVVSYKINFTGQYIKTSDLSKEVYEVTSKQTDASPVPGTTDPATKILPKRTTEYSLSYLIYSSPSQKGKYISLQAVLFIPDYQLSDTALVRDYKNKVLDYLKSNNINPNDYVIDWNPKSASNL